jgi:hypothetical protein
VLVAVYQARYVAISLQIQRSKLRLTRDDDRLIIAARAKEGTVPTVGTLSADPVDGKECYTPAIGRDQSRGQ